MAKTHYQVLGVAPTSTSAEIRSAYRKLVLLHHPDRSSDPSSKAIFLVATEAYDVLGDKDRRREYDDRLAVERTLGERRAKAAPPSSSRRPQQTPSARMAEIKLDINRLNTLHSRGNYPEAEKLARSVLERDQRQPVPYAVLGDLARMSGNRKEALRMYAYAAQFDPRNPVYQRRYDELVESPISAGHISRPTPKPRRDERHSQMFAPLFGLGLVLIACVYIVFAKEMPAFPNLKLISTWTMGLVAMLFFSGVVLGSCMALDGLLDNVRSMGTTVIGRTSPAVALATIAVVNYWGAVVMYVAIGANWKSFDISTSRIMTSVAAGTALIALAAEATNTISGVQVLLWGGNVVYLGTLCGWMVTDALRSAGE